MSITALTGTMSAATLNANFGDYRATLTGNPIVSKDHLIHFYKASLASGDLVQTRTMAWTQSDDMEMRCFFAHGTADAGSRTLTAILSVDAASADPTATKYMSDIPDPGNSSAKGQITITVTSSGASLTHTRTGSSASTANAHGDYTGIAPTAANAAVRFRLLKGVRYRMTMSTNAGTFADAEMGVMLRAFRRKT